MDLPTSPIVILLSLGWSLSRVKISVMLILRLFSVWVLYEV